MGCSCALRPRQRSQGPLLDATAPSPSVGDVCEVGRFSAGFFPRLQVVAYTSFKGQATVWLTRRSISMSFRVGCMQISVAVHEDSRAVDVWVCCSIDAQAACFEQLERVPDMVEDAREASCVGTWVAVVHALHPDDVRTLAVGDTFAWLRASAALVGTLVGLGRGERVEVGTYGEGGVCEPASLCFLPVCDLLPLQVSRS